MLSSASSSASNLLTQQFYNWEIRGRGWVVWPEPVQLEPPFRPFEGHILPRGYFQDDGREGSFLTGLSDRLKGFLGAPKNEALEEPLIEEPEPLAIDNYNNEEIVELQLSLPKLAQPSPDIFEQCLFSLSYCRDRISFEVFGDKKVLIVQIACSSSDANSVFSQLKNHFPEATITLSPNALLDALKGKEDHFTEIREFGLAKEFMLPLRLANELAVDPMVTLCGALEQLYADEIAIFQVMFEPVRNAWTENAWGALTTPDGDPFFEGEKEMLALSKRKLASPLFAVVVRVASIARDKVRTWEIIKSLAGVMRLFDLPTGNTLSALENDGYPNEEHLADLLKRRSRRSGMILNSDELISIAHLPTAAVRSRKLVREIKRTKEVPEALTKDGVWLGINTHDGKKTIVRLPEASRVEHMHVLGTQGTGKSTLLLNLICQDIYNGKGLAVLDPHGDLIDEVLSYIPPERYKDVIVVDPSDESYPIAFNILSAHSTIEKNLLASDLVSVFRRLSTSWGDQMSSVLGNAVLAFLENSRVGTLPELRRFFVEASFRNEFLQTVTDPDIAYYWEKEFPLLKSNSLGPLLTRLDIFLRPKSIRYMVGQRQNKLDFASIMNEGKILLARLSQGIIGEENGFLIGTLLVSKFHQLAISRQAMGAEARRPFYLYIDEFHHFVTPSMASILTGVRKYKLGLILAHQNLTQLRDADVANAVLSSPYTRVSFRVGDQDAKRVAESFSFFEPPDILSLGKGEAICRVQKNDWDFNLETKVAPKPDPKDAKNRREYLHYLTRVQYGMPREKVEEELAKSRVDPKPGKVDPFRKRTSPSQEPPQDKPAEEVIEPNEQVVAKPEEKKNALKEVQTFYQQPLVVETTQAAQPSIEPTAATSSKEKIARSIAEMGRGGEQHRAIQMRIKEAAERHGFRAIVEKEILNKTSHVDVVIERSGVSWACQVGVTNTVDHEVGQVRNCVKAGYENIVVIATKLSTLKKMESAVTVSLGSEVARFTTFYLPDAFINELPNLAAKTIPKEITRKSHGYTIRTETVVLSKEETKMREQTALKTYSASIRRPKHIK